MNQKKQKLEKVKLIDQAKIVIELSKLADTELNKLNLVIKAAMVLKHHACPERTDFIKEAITLSENLGLWKTVGNLAVLGLSVKSNLEEIKYYQEIVKKVQTSVDFKEETHDKST